MANRQIYNSASTGPITGPAYMDQIAGHIKKLYDAAGFPLTAIGGTANAVTATLDPILDGSGLVEGMRFGISWGTTNTGGVTLALNGGAAVSVLDAAGSALVAGALVAGTRSLLEYVGAAFRVINTASSTSLGGTHYYQAFTASGTWTKPVGLDANTMVTVEAWGGGGGGGRRTATPASGGGGGGYQRAVFRLGDVPSSVTVSIGAGGAGATSANGSNGGNTTFGSLLTAWGGGGGAATVTGGGGGGALSAGVAGSSGGAAGLGGGAGGVSANGADATYPHGGAGGAGGASGLNGGSSMFGGAGGGGRDNSVTYGGGGQSLFGGNGGAAGASNGVAGTAPGGGGGACGASGGNVGGAGARGELRIWL